MLKHGRETIVRDFDNQNLLKTPLGRSMSQKQKWIERQEMATRTMQKLHDIGNDAYVIPKTISVDNKRFMVIEERVNGVPLTPLLFRTLDNAKRAHITDSIAQFYADIHTINAVGASVPYKMRYELKAEYLIDFIQTEMKRRFSKSDIRFLNTVYDDLIDAEYDSRLVWAHNDLFEENILYDVSKQTIAVLDFTDAEYSFLQYDILNSYPVYLGVESDFYNKYLKYATVSNLPDNFTDADKWQTISKWHRTAQILEEMDDTAKDLQSANNSPKLIDTMRAQMEKLRQIRGR